MASHPNSFVPAENELARDNPSEQDESTLVEQLRQGDRHAFSVLVQMHQERILAYCLRFLGDLALAQDAGQEVFLTLWKERLSYQDRGVLARYLLTIARHRCLALAKKQRSYRSLLARYAHLLNPGQEAMSMNATESESFTQANAGELQRALAMLSIKHRDVVVLRYLEGLGIKDICELTGLRPGTVKSRLSRAVAALRRKLVDE